MLMGYQEYVIQLQKIIMKRKDYTGIIPPQYTGSAIEVDATVEFKDSYEAKSFYNVAKSR